MSAANLDFIFFDQVISSAMDQSISIIPPSRQGHDVSPEKQRKKRRRVAETNRKRVTVACANCRRLKEKCNGSSPCDRCLKFGRTCETRPATPRAASSLSTPQQTNRRDIERTAHLEVIARHFLGKVPLDNDDLGRVAQNLLRQQSEDNADQLAQGDRFNLDRERLFVKTVSDNSLQYSGELSHWNFAQMISDQIERRLQDTKKENFEALEYWRATHLRTTDFKGELSGDTLPPRDVAMFLAGVYFDFAQTNTPFVERRWVQGKTELLYGSRKTWTPEDQPWICSVLMVLAIGAQFAHLTESRSNEMLNDASGEDRSTEDAVSVTLYHAAVRLIPDIIVTASIDCVQAFLLLGHFALPLDAQGLAYTYFGLAVKMAIQNGMHRRYQGSNLSEETLQLRSRLWWVAYGWEKRVSILHGRPTTIASAEVDWPYPNKTSSENQSNAELAEDNADVMRRLTEWLVHMAQLLHMLRRSPKRSQKSVLQRLMDIRRQYKRWWSDQATSQVPILQLNRSSAHLHLCYHLNLVFLGRPFIFTFTDNSQQEEAFVEAHNARAELVDDAEYSAYEIIDTCAMLDRSSGLTKASYVEFSTCRAAVLVMLAQNLNARCQLFHNKLSLGMDLIRNMAATLALAKSEAPVIEAIDAAIRRLEADRAEEQENSRPGNPDVGREGYSNFKKWASLCRGQQYNGSSGSGDTVETLSGDTSGMQNIMTEFGWSPFDASLFEVDPVCTNELYQSFDGSFFPSSDANPQFIDPAQSDTFQFGSNY